MGHLIPAGTGFHCHRDAEFEFTVEEPEPIVRGPRDHRRRRGRRHRLIILLQTIERNHPLAATAAKG